MVQKRKLVNIFGPSKVSYSKTLLDEYSRDMSFARPIRPGCIVKPTSTDEIKKLIDFANQTLVPLIPISSGPPHFRGDTVPTVGGAVVVDLSEMKKIIRIDRQNRVAMVEPGVTYGELIPALKVEGLRPNLPFVPKNTKSVVGSMLEREPVVMPKYQWDIADPLCCVEVVYGCGDVFRTGSAAGPGTIKEQWAAGGAQKEAAGPLQASWYRVIQGSQGTMGIVTWASMRCELLPSLEEAYLVGSPDIEELLELVHWLIRLRLVNECFVLNDMNLASVMAGIRDTDYRDIKETLPPWTLFFNFAGYEYFPEERVRSQVADMKDVCQRLGLEPVKVIGSVPASELLSGVQVPSGAPYWKLRDKGACHDIFFLSNYERLWALLKIMVNAVDTYGYPVPDMGIYLQPVAQGATCHCEFNFFYDPYDSFEAEGVKRLSAGAVRVLTDNGAFFSRPYGERAGDILNRDAATVAALKKIKGMLDPNHIMNPGKLCF